MSTESSKKRPASEMEEEKKADPFLSSMTFASMGQHLRTCDCDECGGLDSRVIPDAIRAAVKRYKRPLRRTQDRQLLKRHEQIIVYEYTLPRNAEPLIECGTSHRLVWIKRVPAGAVIKSIGTGVIGSAHEVQNRIVLDWKQDDVYLVPSNGGKAVGWVHCSDDGTVVDNENTRGHVVLCIAKVPTTQVETESKAPIENETSTAKQERPWYETIQQVCTQALKQASSDSDTSYIVLDEKHAKKVRASMS